MDCESDDQVAVYFDRKLQQQLGYVSLFFMNLLLYLLL